MGVKAHLTDEQKQRRKKQFSSALLNSQVNVQHKDLTILLRKYPLPFHGFEGRHFRGHPHNK